MDLTTHNDREVLLAKFILSECLVVNTGENVAKMKEFCGYTDEFQSICQEIAKTGYSLETHKNIETKDGYFLTLHRIPYPKNANYLKTEPRQPILLIHGMLGCTGHYILQGDDSLPYLLVEAGFDVWLGNCRGVIYSRDHKTLNYAKDTEYWDFSMHQLGIYDLPAMIDYILQVTNFERLHVIGYSQGCLVFFIMCSEKPEYANKISLFTGLSPLAYVDGAEHPWLPFFSFFQVPLRYITTKVGWCGMRFGLVRKYERFVSAHAWSRGVIKLMLAGAFGIKMSKIKTESVEPAIKFCQGINFGCIYHAMQMFNNSDFKQYDLGAKKNLELYGSETVQDYLLENVTCPVLLYYSDQDWFMPGKNIKLVTSKLANVVDAHKVEGESFSHFDFLIAEEAIEKVYKPMVRTFLDLQNQKV